MRYLLDTNVVSDVLKRQPQVVARFRALPPSALAVSTVTVMEIEYGFERKPAARERLGEVWTALLGDLHVLPYRYTRHVCVPTSPKWASPSAPTTSSSQEWRSPAA